jgi:mono/diheme cytochrome c family protein
MRAFGKKTHTPETVLSGSADAPFASNSNLLAWLIILIACTIMLPSCRRNSTSEPAKPNPAVVESTAQNKDIHSIDLPHDEPSFPPGAGRELFMSRCTVCHSLRYITMQPDFPEKTWVKEVDKMQKTWGAHITDAEAKEIVAYLMLVKGKKP